MDVLRVIINIVIVLQVVTVMMWLDVNWCDRKEWKGRKADKTQNAIFDHYYPLTNPSGCDEAQKRIPFFHHLSINCHSFITPQNGFSSLNGLLISSTLRDIPLRVWGGKGSRLVFEVEGLLNDNEVYFEFTIDFHWFCDSFGIFEVVWVCLVFQRNNLVVLWFIFFNFCFFWYF
jgi:hypothetical protein